MDMTLPGAIQKQVEDAERIQQELYGQKEAPAVDAENTPAPEPVEAEAAPVQEEAPKVETVVEQPPQRDFEQQYKVMKGKYEAEVPRLQHQTRELERQLRDMQARLEQAEKQPERTAEEAPLVTPKDEEDFGSDLVDMVKRASRSEAQAMIKAALAAQEKQFAEFMSRLGAVQQQVVMSESEKFWNRVETLVPDWQVIDNDPEWIAFLDTTPEFTTKTYRELAAEAIAAGKAEAVAKLVQIWRPATPQAAAPTKPNPELQRQVAPPTVKSSSPVQPTEKILSREDYERLYDPRNEQRYGKKKADEMVAEADRAVAEGRVRW